MTYYERHRTKCLAYQKAYAEAHREPDAVIHNYGWHFCHCHVTEEMRHG